jgi:copper resistance protein B
VGNRLPADYESAPAPSGNGGEIQRYAEDAQAGAQKNFGVQPVHDNALFAMFSADRLEYQARQGEDLLLWDVQAWVGRDYNKLWFESEGAWLTDAEDFEEAQAELFYSRNVASYWDFRIGIRHDFNPSPERSFAAVGIQGLAPQWFEVDATAYIGEEGDFSAAVEVEYDLLLSQRLIFQPRLETSLSLRENPEYGEGTGIHDVELGARLRYELHRKFAPYVGVSWHRLLGGTEDFAEAEGEDADTVSWVAGVRFWF